MQHINLSVSQSNRRLFNELSDEVQIISSNLNMTEQAVGLLYSMDLEWLLSAERFRADNVELDDMFGLNLDEARVRDHTQKEGHSILEAILRTIDEKNSENREMLGDASASVVKLMLSMRESMSSVSASFKEVFEDIHELRSSSWLVVNTLDLVIEYSAIDVNGNYRPDYITRYGLQDPPQAPVPSHQATGTFIPVLGFTSDLRRPNHDTLVHWSPDFSHLNRYSNKMAFEFISRTSAYEIRLEDKASLFFKDGDQHVFFSELVPDASGKIEFEFNVPFVIGGGSTVGSLQYLSNRVTAADNATYGVVNGTINNSSHTDVDLRVPDWATQMVTDGLVVQLKHTDVRDSNDYWAKPVGNSVNYTYNCTPVSASKVTIYSNGEVSYGLRVRCEFTAVQRTLPFFSRGDWKYKISDRIPLICQFQLSCYLPTWVSHMQILTPPAPFIGSERYTNYEITANTEMVSQMKIEMEKIRQKLTSNTGAEPFAGLERALGGGMMLLFPFAPTTAMGMGALMGVMQLSTALQHDSSLEGIITGGLTTAVLLGSLLSHSEVGGSGGDLYSSVSGKFYASEEAAASDLGSGTHNLHRITRPSEDLITSLSMKSSATKVLEAKPRVHTIRKGPNSATRHIYFPEMEESEIVEAYTKLANRGFGELDLDDIFTRFIRADGHIDMSTLDGVSVPSVDGRGSKTQVGQNKFFDTGHDITVIEDAPKIVTLQEDSFFDMEGSVDVGGTNNLDRSNANISFDSSDTIGVGGPVRLEYKAGDTVKLKRYTVTHTWDEAHDYGKLGKQLREYSEELAELDEGSTEYENIVNKMRGLKEGRDNRMAHAIDSGPQNMFVERITTMVRKIKQYRPARDGNGNIIFEEADIGVEGVGGSTTVTIRRPTFEETGEYLEVERPCTVGLAPEIRSVTLQDGESFTTPRTYRDSTHSNAGEHPTGISDEVGMVHFRAKIPSGMARQKNLTHIDDIGNTAKGEYTKFMQEDGQPLDYSLGEGETWVNDSGGEVTLDLPAGVKVIDIVENELTIKSQANYDPQNPDHLTTERYAPEYGTEYVQEGEYLQRWDDDTIKTLLDSGDPGKINLAEHIIRFRKNSGFQNNSVIVKEGEPFKLGVDFDKHKEIIRYALNKSGYGQRYATTESVLSYDQILDALAEERPRFANGSLDSPDSHEPSQSSLSQDWFQSFEDAIMGPHTEIETRTHTLNTRAGPEVVTYKVRTNKQYGYDLHGYPKESYQATDAGGELHIGSITEEPLVNAVENYGLLKGAHCRDWSFAVREMATGVRGTSLIGKNTIQHLRNIKGQFASHLGKFFSHPVRLIRKIKSILGDQLSMDDLYESVQLNIP